MKASKTGRPAIALLLAAVAVVGVVLLGFIVYLRSMRLNIEFIENAEVGVNEIAYSDQFVKSIKNGRIISETTPIDTSHIGEVTVSLAVQTVFGSEEVFTYTISVVDRESPEITAASRLEISIGNEIDLLKGVSVTDNSGEEITVAVEGSYDIHTVGEYELTYVACDSSLNKAEKTVILSVVDRESPVISFTSYLEISLGNEIDLLEGVSVTDNSGEEITVTVEGSYDVNQAGIYELKLVAVDSSLNKAEETLTLRVRDAASSSGGTWETGTVSFVTSKGFQGEIRNGVTYIDGYLIANKTYSLPASYGSGLTVEMLSAFNQMAAAAKADGLNIFIVSGYRSYSYQENLYNRYVDRDGAEKADTYSARAGHSEHQSGLAADVNSVDNSFAQTPEAAWLSEHCYQYGFILRYPEEKTDETGYQYEPWHIRYVGTELAAELYNGGDWITMEDYFGITSKYQ